MPSGLTSWWADIDSLFTASKIGNFTWISVAVLQTRIHKIIHHFSSGSTHLDWVRRATAHDIPHSRSLSYWIRRWWLCWPNFSGSVHIEWEIVEFSYYFEWSTVSLTVKVTWCRQVAPRNNSRCLKLRTVIACNTCFTNIKNIKNGTVSMHMYKYNIFY